MIPPKENKAEIPVPNIEFIAKTFTSPDGRSQKGVSVLVHCLIVGLVARELVRRQPDWLKQRLFPEGSELSAAVHDIGKINPADQQKLYHQIVEGLLKLVSPALIQQIKHPVVSEAALQEFGPYIAKIAGRHHGSSPSLLQKGGPNDLKFGGANWQKERLKVLSELQRLLQADWPDIASDIIADVLSGLTTVADWIGSGGVFDAPGETIKLDCAELTAMAKRAVDSAGFIQPQFKKNLSFRDVFPFPPKDVQQKLIEAIDRPGVYVLEAPMGLGKTEAALYAAYQAMSENRATGIYFALPTQLTSNKMVNRMNQFLDAILEESCHHRKSLLLHGNAWLMNVFGEEGEPGGSWFDHRKRGLLAPFAVGTVDQALMAAMNVRHGFVRTFGLAGKVVILDEIHSYDSYTGTIIERLVSTLRQIHCTVIILSATLTGKQRNALLGISDVSASSDLGYPLVSALPNNAKAQNIPSETSKSSTVAAKIQTSDGSAIKEALRRAERGEQVLWLENTVEEAQKYFKVFGARANGLGIEVGLLHSRFLKTDREQNEKKWVDLFGREGSEKRSLQGRILVGTQVLEQSLDIDGDFLITRICPTDMLLQRIGRLWRHRQNDGMRPESAKCEVWILAPPLETAVSSDKYFGKTAWVYAPYVLCRTLEVWQDLTKISLPDQIRELIESTYSERPETGKMAVYRSKIEQQRDSLKRMARIGLSKDGETFPESQATTRYSDSKTVDVLLVRNRQQDGAAVRIRLLDGSDLVLPPGLRFRDKKQWRQKAAALQKNTVTVPENKAPAFCQNEMNFLKGFVYLGDEEARSFRAAQVTDSGSLIGFDQQAPLEGFQLSYDSRIGYIAKKQ